MVMYVGNLVCGSVTVHDRHYYLDNRTLEQRQAAVEELREKNRKKQAKYNAKVGTTTLTKRSAENRKKRLARLAETGVQKKGNSNDQE